MPNREEVFKGSIHAATMGLAAAMSLYNGLEYHKRGKLHLAVNSALYGALWAFEGYQTWRHWRHVEPGGEQTDWHTAHLW